MPLGSGIVVYMIPTFEEQSHFSMFSFRMKMGEKAIAPIALVYPCVWSVSPEELD